MREYKTPPQLAPLVTYLKRLPTINGLNGGDAPGGFYKDGRWWVVFEIALADPLGLVVVRRLAEAVNDVSLSPDETPPTVFMPIVGPREYRHGIPEQSREPPPIWWALESTRAGVPIAGVIEHLEKKLPRPTEDQSQWM